MSCNDRTWCILKFSTEWKNCRNTLGDTSCWTTWTCVRTAMIISLRIVSTRVQYDRTYNVVQRSPRSGSSMRAFESRHVDTRFQADLHITLYANEYACARFSVFYRAINAWGFIHSYTILLYRYLCDNRAPTIHSYTL